MIYRLKQARKMKGQSLREAAKGLGMSHEGLNKFERGKLKINSKKLIEFSKYYDVSVDYLSAQPSRSKIELSNVQFFDFKTF